MSIIDEAPILTTKALSRRFCGLLAVRDVSLSLRTGSLHALIGPNGAGKSTMVNLLAGALRPSQGQIVCHGQDVTAWPSWRRARLGIGRSFQRTNIFPSMTVFANVHLAAETNPAGERDGKQEGVLERIRVPLSRVDLTGQEQRLAGTLSHGEQRQLEIAMVLATGARVLLLDEPLAGMGPEESARASELIAQLAQDHAVLLVEHDMDIVFRIADWITVMADGEVIAQGEPNAIRADKAVRVAYLGGESV